MKITPTIEKLAAGIESWAREVGWKKVAVKFADEYHRQGGGVLIPQATDEKGIRNAIQRVKRIFGLRGPRYIGMANKLSSVALAAMPKRRRIELEDAGSTDLAKAKVMESFGTAMAALTISCPSATEKLNRLIGDLQALIPIVEILIH